MDIALRLRELIGDIADTTGAVMDTDGAQIFLVWAHMQECSVSVSADGTAIEIFSPLCVADEDEDADELFERALALNLHAVHTRGATIALSEDAPVLVLRVRQAVEKLDGHWLSSTLAQVLDTASELRHELNAAPEANSYLLSSGDKTVSA